jgi:site-specific recombinase XerC
MPDGTDTEKRDRALIAFIFLTGARDRAVASLKLKHLNIDTGNKVKTKRAKTFVTQVFPVGELPLAIVREWVGFLKVVKAFGTDDPLFPATGGKTSWHGTVRNRRTFTSALADEDADPQNLQITLCTPREFANPIGTHQRHLYRLGWQRLHPCKSHVDAVGQGERRYCPVLRAGVI